MFTSFRTKNAQLSHYWQHIQILIIYTHKFRWMTLVPYWKHITTILHIITTSTDRQTDWLRPHTERKHNKTCQQQNICTDFIITVAVNWV